MYIIEKRSQFIQIDLYRCIHVQFLPAFSALVECVGMHLSQYVLYFVFDTRKARTIFHFSDFRSSNLVHEMKYKQKF